MSPRSRGFHALFPARHKCARDDHTDEEVDDVEVIQARRHHDEGVDRPENDHHPENHR